MPSPNFSLISYNSVKLGGLMTGISYFSPINLKKKHLQFMHFTRFKQYTVYMA